MRMIVLVTILKRPFILLDISKSNMSSLSSLQEIELGRKTRRIMLPTSFTVCRLGTLQEQPITSFPNSSNL